ncbi:MaoC family dehydratase [Roseomonas sp. KE2513]|uniref:MaoC family dehydratase n=1 Tax=Roseomonas sp. KE2513 TaxID=2479202 RepID=UPI0018DF369B|nr:MaoC family dehydratase [Roseomonas sp. KE2513]
MLAVETPEDLAAHVGTPIGPSPWRSVEEEKVIAFARLCGDDHWIHTDAKRAARETEFGGVIAQGFLTLSMTTSMLGETFDVRRASRWLNYGIERLRFTGPVRAGDRVRLRGVLAAVEPARGGATRIEIDLSVEAEGAAKPVLVARSILLAFP